MNGESVSDFDRDQVEARLRRRAEEIATRRAHLRREGENMRDSELADYDQHPADQGTETHEQELDETREMMLEAEADNVEVALRRLESGEYGICIDCGKEIPRERLEAIPEAIRCIEDQARYEAMLRARWPPPPRDRTP
jgi:RNA polymerase-binding transcription factor DksA